jgi:predicted nucleic acid-binding protein
MITAVIDNQLWIKLLLDKSPSLGSIINQLSTKELRIYTSPTIESDLITQLNSKLKPKLAISFVSIFFPLFEVTSPSENRLPFPPPLPSYLDLCLHSHPDYLVPLNYQQFKALDGYQKINVLESDNFLTILS